MNPNSEPSSDDKIPSFFLNDDKISKENLDSQNKVDEINANGTIPNVYVNKRSKITNNGIHWPSLVIGAMIAIACIFCGVLIANMINDEATPILDNTPQKQTKTITQPLSALINNASPILGDPNAPITLVEFGDYQCTFCSKFFHETENSIITNYVKTGKVKILFKDYVVQGQDSINAANAAHCANDQKLFWEYHSMLYNNWAGEDTGWADLEHLHEFANTIGLDMNVFSACMSDLKWIDLVNLSIIDGQKLGVTGTPTFFIIDQNNDVVKIVGAQHYDVFKQVFDSILE